MNITNFLLTIFGSFNTSALYEEIILFLFHNNEDIISVLFPNSEVVMSLIVPFFPEPYFVGQKSKGHGVITSMEINMYKSGELLDGLKNVRCGSGMGVFINSFMGRVPFYMYKPKNMDLLFQSIMDAGDTIFIQLFRQYNEHFKKVIILIDINSESPISPNFFIFNLKKSFEKLIIKYDHINHVMIILLTYENLKFELIFRDTRKIQMDLFMERAKEHRIGVKIINLHTKDSSKTLVGILKHEERLKIFNSNEKGYNLLKSLVKRELIFFKRIKK